MENNIILIVDDNTENLKVLSNILTQDGYDIRVAMDGLQALESLMLETPALILLDINMPNMDGYQTCEEIKKIDDLKDIPVLFISAMTEVLNKVVAFGVGGADYIQKPFEIEEVLARVKAHIELKSARDQLKNLNDKLEQKVADRTQELHETNLKLQDANKELLVLDKAKTEFLQMLSHELRTPLNGILGFMDLLKELNSDDELNDIISGIELSSHRLEKLSYDALLITRLNSHKHDVYLSNVKLSELIADLLEKAQENIKEKNISVSLGSFDNSTILKTDLDLLKDSIERILDNAIHFTRPESNIFIETKRINEQLIISIIDEGDGFPDKILNSKLSAFSPGKEHIDQNVGVDLYLVDLIISALNGKIEFGNTPGKGAYVNFIFPAEMVISD